MTIFSLEKTINRACCRVELDKIFSKAEPYGIEMQLNYIKNLFHHTTVVYDHGETQDKNQHDWEPDEDEVNYFGNS